MEKLFYIVFGKPIFFGNCENVLYVEVLYDTNNSVGSNVINALSWYNNKTILKSIVTIDGIYHDLYRFLNSEITEITLETRQANQSLVDTVDYTAAYDETYIFQWSW